MLRYSFLLLRNEYPNEMKVLRTLTLQVCVFFLPNTVQCSDNESRFYHPTNTLLPYTYLADDKLFSRKLMEYIITWFYFLWFYVKIKGNQNASHYIDSTIRNKGITNSPSTVFFINILCRLRKVTLYVHSFLN